MPESVEDERLLFVCGLRDEAVVARKRGAIAVCGGAAILAKRLATVTQVRLVVSFGLCGGLDPALRCGDLVIGKSVTGSGQSFEADPVSIDRLAERLGASGEKPRIGVVAGVAEPALTSAGKAGLHQATGAIAVDMESLIAGRFAAERGIPFAILRAVSDPAERNLPPVAASALTSKGSIDVPSVLHGVLTNPAQIPDLVAAARDSAKAFRSLRRARSLPGLFLGLGLADL